VSVKSNSLPQSRPDPKAVYDYADRFHLTEFFLRNKLQITDAEFKTIQIPGMVLCAFTAELYLMMTPVARTYSLIGSTSAALAGSRLSNVPGHVLDLGEDGAELWVSRRGMSH